MMSGKETRLATESDAEIEGHVPVLLSEAVGALGVEPGGRFLDGTVGSGGFAEQLLEESSPDGLVVGLDWDQEALDVSRARLKRFGSRLILQRRSFAEARSVLQELGWDGFHGIVLDLGVSSLQLSRPDRGFSFQSDGPLDMRMDLRRKETAASLLATLNAKELSKILREFGELPGATRIARAIVRQRDQQPFRSTRQLARLVRRVDWRKGKTHPATRLFQALRIAVNQELEQLRNFLSDAYLLLRPGAVLAIVSFHSLEHRIVKLEFRKWEMNCLCPPGVFSCNCGWSCKGQLLFRKAVKPSRDEVERNPRSRSAQLRAVRRIGADLR